MLTKKLPINLVTGIVVYRAHKYVTPFLVCTRIKLVLYLHVVTKLLSVQVCTMFDCCKSRTEFIGSLFFQIDRIIESCQEAFILRLYRENNKVQFME